MLVRRILLVSLIGWGLILAGCATYQSKVAAPRQLLKEGRVSEALPQFEKLASKASDDQLVYLLEYGTALQMAGQYKESNVIFTKADKLADLNDFHSVSNIAAATLGSETMIQYKGESYEKVLINAMMAINYLMLGQPDEALVEARRLNEKLTAMKLDGRKPYELNPFAKYLSGLIWESEHKYDDAYISFNEAYKLDGTNPFLPADLIRASKNARREDTYRTWKKEFPQIQEDVSWYDPKKGELVILVQQGWGPEKHMTPGSHRFPALYPVYSQTQAIKAEVEIKGSDPVSAISQKVYDVQDVAIQTLKDDYGALIARRVGGIAAKAVVSDQIRQKNELLGVIAWVAMNVADQADLRQWSSLPQSIQMIRLKLNPGEYKLRLQGLNSTGSPTADQIEAQVKIQVGRKTFFNFRTLR